jgi:hypothetical protein
MLLATRAKAVAAAVLAVTAATAVYLAATADPGPDPAPRAGEPSCQKLTGRYPQSLGTLTRTRTATEGAAVWGEGAATIRCGLEPLLPTEELCVTVEGVDWVLREKDSAGGRKVIVTYGRTPAAEAVLSPDVPSDIALVELSKAVAMLPKNGRKCITASDVAAPSAGPEQSIPPTGHHP